MIDDVDYLISNAEKDSQVIYIDSTLRNKMFYPFPNEYTVEFDQPFKLVYGFDILDAAVPVTMYNVDVYNNGINFTVVQKNPASLVPIDPEQYLREVSTCTSFIEMFDRDVETFIAIGEESIMSSYIAGVSSPDDNYIMYYRKRVTTQEIQVKALQAQSEFYFFSINNVEYCIKDTQTNAFIIEILKEREFNIQSSGNGSIDVIYFERHEIDSTTYASIKTANAYIVTVSNYIKHLDYGNYDILTIVNDLNDLLNQALVDVEPTTPVPKKQGKMMFSSSHLLLLNGAKGELIKSLGFDTYPAATSTGTNYKGWTIGSNYLVFGGVFDSSTSKYKIVSPGLISLLGERFTILRVKELEDHLYGSFSYMKMTPGVGMFKMAASFGGITNLRFDYTTVIRKPFHPIGKLSKLSIRFETSSGRLYDFKGVNHQLMVNIKFYVPTQKLKFTKSILNPNYDPNLMQYMAQNKSIQYREDSDEEEEFDEDRYRETYQKHLDEYDYSSSENEKNTSDSEEDLEVYMKNNNMKR